MVGIPIFLFCVIIGIYTYLFVTTLRAGRTIAHLNDEIASLKEQIATIRPLAEQEKRLAIDNALKEHERRFDEDNAHLLSQALLNETAQELCGEIASVIDGRFSRFSQEFLGNLSDEAEGLCNDVKIEIVDKIWDSFQSYKAVSKDTPLMLPDRCRMAYTKGNMTLFLIEQSPQVRTVTVEKEMLKQHSMDNAASSTKTACRFTLAYPYVYFLSVFHKEKFSYLEVYFRNKPLTSAREHLYLAPIPNMFRDDRGENVMCMGSDFENRVKQETNLVRQCELAVSEFWQATFSADLGGGKPHEIDKRIGSYGKWQDNTAKDPLFILGVNWTKGKTVKGVIESKLEDRIRGHELDPLEHYIRAVLDKGTERLSERVKQEIANVRTNIPNSVVLQQQAKVALDGVVLDHAKRVYKHLSPKYED